MVFMKYLRVRAAYLQLRRFLVFARIAREGRKRGENEKRAKLQQKRFRVDDRVDGADLFERCERIHGELPRTQHVSGNRMLNSAR